MNVVQESAELRSVRCQLAKLAASRRTRQAEWSEARPIDWRPTQIQHPDGDGFFTRNGAWDFLVERLDAGEPIQEISLRDPPGRKAYVMKIRVSPTLPYLYVKLELGAGVVLGRSFHYDKEDSDD